MLKNVICPYQVVVQRDEVVDRDIDSRVVFLIAEGALSTVNLLVSFTILVVERLVLLVEILLEELLGQVSGEAK